VFLGKAVQTVNPPNGSVGASQISDGSIALAKLSATGTKDATTFLRGDNTFASAGLTEVDQWKLTADQQLTTATITTNLSRVLKIGTGMTESSGVFSFPSTGIWLIMVDASFSASGSTSDSRYLLLRTQTTTNNSTYNNVARAGTNIHAFTTNEITAYAHSTLLFDVTDTSTHKVKFETDATITSNYYLKGTSGDVYTNFIFIRIGDT